MIDGNNPVYLSILDFVLNLKDVHGLSDLVIVVWQLLPGWQFVERFAENPLVLVLVLLDDCNQFPHLLLQLFVHTLALLLSLFAWSSHDVVVLVVVVLAFPAFAAAFNYNGIEGLHGPNEMCIGK